MKPPFILPFLVAALLVPLRAEDWATMDGKIYPDVKVLKVESDAVTILDRDGGALIPLSSLPAALQARFHYDPAQARLAAAARVKKDAADAQALQTEAALAKKIRAREEAASNAQAKANAPAPAIADTDPFHNSRDSLLKGGRPFSSLGPTFPSQNQDGKNTSGQSHPMQIDN